MVDPDRRRRRTIGTAGVALAAALLLAVAGSTGLAAAAGFSGVLCGLAAVRDALRSTAIGKDAPPLDTNAPGLHAAVAADLLLATVWEATAFVRRVPELGRAAADVESAVARWRDRGWLEHPERAHPLPPPLEKPSLARISVRGGGEVERLVFASEYVPADPEIAGAYQSHEANRSAQVLLFRHRTGSPRPTLISLHGFGMGRLASDLPWLRVRGWDVAGLHRELGMDVAYVILPFHGPRSAGVSGAGFFDVHPLFAGAALGQSLWELRRLAGWLRAQGSPAIGVHGISLGGAAAALFASFDASLASAIPMNPAVDLAQIFWRHLPEARRREWRAAGLGPERIAQAWSLVAPLRHRPRAPLAGRLVVGGAVDQVALPEGVRALWSHWGEPAIHWMPGAHLVWRGGEAFASRVRRHLRETLLAESPPAAPLLSRFRA